MQQAINMASPSYRQLGLALGGQGIWQVRPAGLMGDQDKKDQGGFGR